MRYEPVIDIDWWCYHRHCKISYKFLELSRPIKLTGIYVRSGNVALDRVEIRSGVGVLHLGQDTESGRYSILTLRNFLSLTLYLLATIKAIWTQSYEHNACMYVSTYQKLIRLEYDQKWIYSRIILILSRIKSKTHIILITERNVIRSILNFKNFKICVQ